MEWDGLAIGNGGLAMDWMAAGLDGSTDWTGSAIDCLRWIGWLVIGSAMDWTARQIGWARQLNGMGRLGNRLWTARDGLDDSGRLAMDWMARAMDGNGRLGVAWRRAMDGNGKLTGQRDGSAIGNGLGN